MKHPNKSIQIKGGCFDFFNLTLLFGFLSIVLMCEVQLI
jgi:hypothetical protein